MLTAPRVFGPHLRHIIPVRAMTTNAKAARSHRPVQDCETTGMGRQSYGVANVISRHDGERRGRRGDALGQTRLLPGSRKTHPGNAEGGRGGNRLFEWDRLSCVCGVLLCRMVS